MSVETTQNLRDQLLRGAFDIAVAELGTGGSRDGSELKWRMKAVKGFDPGLSVIVRMNADDAQLTPANVISADIELLDNEGDIYQSEFVNVHQNPELLESDYSRGVFEGLMSYQFHPHDICMSAFLAFEAKRQAEDAERASLEPIFSSLIPAGFAERMEARGIDVSNIV